MKIVEIRIENDKVNNMPTLVFVDENGIEWVQDDILRVIEKAKSWYFQPKPVK